MKWINKILSAWLDELRVVSHDVGIIIFVVLVPLFYPLLYAYIYNNEQVREIPFALVDDSHSPQSRDFVRKVDATPTAALYASCLSMGEAEEMMKRREVYGIIHIPASFARDLSRGDQTTVGLYCDMSTMLYYKGLLMAASSASLEVNRGIKVGKFLPGSTDRQDAVTAMPVTYDSVALYNPQSGFASYLIPPVLMLIIQQTLLLGIGMSMGSIRECNGGLIPAQHSATSMVLGKTLFYLPLYVVSAVYMFAVVTRGFSLPQLGDYTTFLAFIVPYIVACIMLGITLSMLVYRREDCIMLFVFMSVPLLFLSGISWPGSAIPEFWKYVSWLFPSTFGMNGYMRITSMGATLTDVSAELSGLMVQIAAYFATATLLYYRRLTRQ